MATYRKIKAENLSRGLDEILAGNGIENNQINIYTQLPGLKERDKFIKLFQEQAKIINNCKPITTKIFFYFLCECGYSDKEGIFPYIEVDIFTIAKNTNTSESSVKRAIKELIEMGVLLLDKDLNDKRRNTYFINPTMAWKGSPIDRQKSIKMLNENQLQIGFPSVISLNPESGE